MGSGSLRHQLNLGSITLSYLAWDGGGEPTIALHGMADCAAVWRSLGDALAGKIALVAPDLRGHGDSSKPATGYDFDDYIADLEQLMDALGWRSAHVIGHSWGAKLAAIWATRSPDRVRSLILVDPFLLDRLPGVMALSFPLLYRVLPFLKLAGTFESRDRAEAIARSLKQYRGWSDLQQSVFEDSTIVEPDGRCRGKLSLDARDGIFDAVLHEAALIRPLSVPSLLILPEGGLNRFSWQTASIRRYLKNLEVRSVPGNHWCHLVEPDAFNAAIAAYLNGL